VAQQTQNSRFGVKSHRLVAYMAVKPVGLPPF